MWVRKFGYGMLLLLWTGVMLAVPVPGESGVAGAETRDEVAMDALQRFVDRLQTLEAQFTQRIEESGGKSPREEQGKFAAAKPGLFRWDYVHPFAQLILCDGRNIWYYEPDLRQVTRTTAQRLNETPAGFLVAGSHGGKPAERLRQAFAWHVGTHETLHLPAVHLKPKVRPERSAESASFREIVITLDARGESLVSLVVEDTLGHRSQFSFTSVRINQPIPEDRFRFDVPAGVDVVTE